MDWQSIDISLRPQVEKIRNNDNRVSHSFAGLFLWQRGLQLQLAFNEAKDCYYVSYGLKGENSYFFPMGSDKGKIDFWQQLMPGSRLYYCNEDDLKWLETNFSLEQSIQYTIEESRDDWEYLYDRNALVEAKGKKYHSLRKGINKTEEIINWDAVPLNSHNVKTILTIEEEWLEQKEDSSDYLDFNAISLAADYFTRLGMMGILVYSGEEQRPTGFALGLALNQNTFDSVFCKSLNNGDYEGVAHALYVSLPPRFDTVNLEEDLGLPGLRTHKEGTCPKGFNKMYTVTKL